MGLARPILEEDVIAVTDGHGAGTPMYVSPEQARDARDADSRSDLYSLGCAFYRMLTGELPFRGESSVEIVLAKVRGHFQLPSELVPGLPQGLDDVIALLLAPHPDDRYQSATDLIIDLEQLRLASPALTFLGGFAEPVKRADEEGLSDDDMTAVSLDSPQRTERRWFVEWRRANGDWERRRYTARQIIERLEDEAFARTAQASIYRDNFRPLYELSEFHDAVVARLNPHIEPEGNGEALPPIPAPSGGRGRWFLTGLLGLLGVAAALGYWIGQVRH
jgi:serine/threonine-protein kinase